MREGLEKELEDCLTAFKTDRKINTIFKKLVVMNVGVGDELESYVARFIKLAKSKQDTYSLALGYSLLFMLYFGNDVELAISYNEKARELLSKESDYQEKEGILTVMNNSSMAHIMKGEYMEAYYEILSAIKIADRKERLPYLIAFTNNCSIILSEFGLYKKAKQHVEENLSKRCYAGESCFFSTVFLLSNIYCSLKDTKSLRKLLNQYTDELKLAGLFDYAILYKQYLEAAILDHKPEEATYYYHKLMKEYNFEKGDGSTISSICLSMGRYFAYLGNNEEAKKLYDFVIDHMYEMFGQKNQIVEEASNLYEKLGNYETAYQYLKQAHGAMLQHVEFIDDIYRKELDDVWEKNRLLSFEELYERLFNIARFGQYIAASLTMMQLHDSLQTNIPKVLNFDECELYIYLDEQDYLETYDKRRLYIQPDSLFATCIKQRKPIIEGTMTKQVIINKNYDAMYKSTCKSVFLQQVIYKNTVLGVVLLSSKYIQNFSYIDHGLMQILVDYISIAIHNIQQFQKTVYKSRYDYLSDLYNRSALMEFGKEMLLNAIELQTSICALMMDIDNFKTINDEYGHVVGDDVIKMVAQIIKKFQRHGISARYGGEEFLLLIDQISKGELYQIAEEIRNGCEATAIVQEEHEIKFTLSIGCAYEKATQCELQELFDLADQRLYVAKYNGKNCIQM